MFNKRELTLLRAALETHIHNTFGPTWQRQPKDVERLRKAYGFLHQKVERAEAVAPGPVAAAAAYRAAHVKRPLPPAEVNLPVPVAAAPPVAGSPAPIVAAAPVQAKL